jgi:hypothetical protein
MGNHPYTLLTGQGADDCANRIFFLGHKDTQGPSY